MGGWASGLANRHWPSGLAAVLGNVTRAGGWLGLRVRAWEGAEAEECRLPAGRCLALAAVG